MSSSAFDGTFSSLTLTRTIKAGYTDEETGRWVEGAPTIQTLRAWFKTTSNPAIAQQVGVDAESVAVRGRLLEPVSFPSSVQSGAEFTLTQDGRVKRLVLTIPPPSPLAELGEILGAQFFGRLYG
jgi:hypothetical protein